MKILVRKTQTNPSMIMKVVKMIMKAAKMIMKVAKRVKMIMILPMIETKMKKKVMKKLKKMRILKMMKKKKVMTRLTMRMKIMMGAAQSSRETLVTAAISWYPMCQLNPQKTTVVTVDALCSRGRKLWPASSAAPTNAVSASSRKTKRKKLRTDKPTSNKN